LKINKKELAKFASGITAWEAIVHLSLENCNMLPISWCNIEISTNFNTIQIIIPGIISGLLIWYAWFKQESNPKQ
jgi:hypothetical protein